VVWTIAAQPLDVNRRPAAQRSPVWFLYNDTVHRDGPGADFFALYNAAQALQRDASLYQATLEARTPYCCLFRYLPIVAQSLGQFFLRFAPLTAFRLWVVATEIMLGCLLLLWGRGTRGWLRYFGLLSLLLSGPFFLEVYMGQFTFATVALLSISLGLSAPAARSARPWSTVLKSLTYAGAVLLKVFPLVAVVALVRKKASWLPLSVALVAVTALTTPYFAARPEEVRLFLGANLATSEGLDSGNFGVTYGLYLLLSDLRLNLVLHDWTTALMLWRFGVLGLTALLVLVSRKDQVGFGAVALILAHFVSYTHVWEHHVSAIIVMGLWLLQMLDQEDPSNKPLRYCLVACVVALILPTPFALFDTLKNPGVWDPFDGQARSVRYWVLLPKALPTAMLYLICVARLLQAGFTWPWHWRLTEA
jgi:hypothetical protein